MKLGQQSVVEGRYVMSYQLSSAQWRQVESFLPGRPGWVGVTAKDNRTFVNGVLWVLRSGAQWKDLPPGYGNWKSPQAFHPLGQGRNLGEDLPSVAGRPGQQIRDD